MAFSIKPLLVLASSAIVLAGCNGSSNAPVADSPAASPTVADAASPAPEASADAASTAADSLNASLISSKGIGSAQLGTPLWKLKETLGGKAEFTVKSPFIVDFDAIAVSQEGEVQYYILYLANQTFSDDNVIQGLYTDNPKYRTAEGVGPGIELKTAELAYGKATLAYNTQNESREYARFERQPANNVSFSTGNGNTDPAGNYTSTAGEYHETQSFKENATIKSVLVVCLTEDCIAPSAEAPPSGEASPPAAASPGS